MSQQPPVRNFFAEPSFAVDLLPRKEPSLLFTTYISRGPGEMERSEYYMGESECGRFDVLWVKNESINEFNAAAWVPQTTFESKEELCENLLIAYWSAEKVSDGSEGPNFNEIAGDKRALLDGKTVLSLVHRVWPNW